MNEPIARHPARVIKLGGSLLSNSGAPQRIERWLEHLTEQQKTEGSPVWRNLWIVGGGELANTVRDWDAKFSLAPEFAHWACIDLMDINARLLCAWFPHWEISDQLSNQLKGTAESWNQVFLVSRWLRERKSNLPQSWATTSDSIALFVAESLQAEELVLLKSCDPPDLMEEVSLESLASSDFVDRQFVPQIRSLTKTINVRFVNLSNDRFCEAVLKR